MASSLYLQGGALTQKTLKEEILQINHGFSLGHVLRFEEFHVGGLITASPVVQYKLAQADSPQNSEVVGIVTEVRTVDKFELSYSGAITIPNDSVNFVALNASLQPVFFLSGQTAGLLTDTPPSNIGSVVKPVLTKNASNNGYLIINNLGVQIGGSSTIAVDEIQPVGTIVPFAGINIPDTWLECNGVSCSVEQYAELYDQVLNTTGDRAPLYGHSALLSISGAALAIGATLSQGSLVGTIEGITFFAGTTYNIVTTQSNYTSGNFSYPNAVFKTGPLFSPSAMVQSAYITHFKTPDIRGRFAIGKNKNIISDPFPLDLVDSGLPVMNIGGFGGEDANIVSAISVVLSGSANNAMSSISGNTLNNLPPYLTTTYIIKAKPYTRAAIIGGVDIPYTKLLVRDMRTINVGGVTGDLGLYTNTEGDGGLGTLRIQIQGKDGNVGVNTGTNPIGATFHIKGVSAGNGVALRVEDDVVLGGGGSIFFGGTYSYSTGNFISPLVSQSQVFYTNGQQRLYIDPTGWVGVGGANKTGSYMFEVGSLVINVSSKFHGPISCHRATSFDQAVTLAQLTEMPEYDWSIQRQPIVQDPIITTRDSVGIGYAMDNSSSELIPFGLSIKGPSSADSPRKSELRLVCTTLNGGGKISWYENDSTNQNPLTSEQPAWSMVAVRNGNFTIYDDRAGSFSRLQITNTGNVGIGTQNPLAKLEIFGADNSGNIFRVGIDATKSVTIGSSGNDDICIGGNVAFSGTANQFISKTGTAPSVIKFIDGGLQFLTCFQTVSNGGVSVPLTPSMTINKNGNVGIGQVAATEAALQVNGNIICNDPTLAEHVATKNYVDNFEDTAWRGDTDANFVFTNPAVRVGIGLSGDSIEARLHVSGTSIFGTNSSDSSKFFGDVTCLGDVSVANNMTVSGNIELQTAPSAPNHAVTKNYVDTFKETSWIGAATDSEVYVVPGIKVGVGLAPLSNPLVSPLFSLGISGGNIHIDGKNYGIMTPVDAVSSRPKILFCDTNNSGTNTQIMDVGSVAGRYNLFSGLLFQRTSTSLGQQKITSPVQNNSAQLLLMERGYTRTAIGEGIWTLGRVTSLNTFQGANKSFRLNTNTINTISSQLPPGAQNDNYANNGIAPNTTPNESAGAAIATQMSYLAPAPIIGSPPANAEGYPVGQVWYVV